MTEASDTTVIDDNSYGHAEIYAGTRFEKTSSSARQEGRGGAELSATLKTSGENGGIKDFVVTSARGDNSGKSGGTANGTLDTGPQGASSSFDVSAHSDGASGGSVTRTTIHRDPNASSRTEVTRTDTSGGALNSQGTITSGPGQDTGRDGTFNGHSDTGATVTIDHAANSDDGDGVFSFGKAVGTLFTDVGGNFNGTWDGTDLDADLARHSGEDTTTTDGWRNFQLDQDGLVWQGETTTRTIHADEDASGAGGSARVHVEGWDFHVTPTGVNLTLQDHTSTLTQKTGQDSANESQVDEWDDSTYVTTFSSGVLTSEHTTTDKGQHSKTLTATDDSNKLKIERHAEKEDKSTNYAPPTTNPIFPVTLGEPLVLNPATSKRHLFGRA